MTTMLDHRGEEDTMPTYAPTDEKFCRVCGRWLMIHLPPRAQCPTTPLCALCGRWPEDHRYISETRLLCVEPKTGLSCGTAYTYTKSKKWVSFR